MMNLFTLSAPAPLALLCVITLAVCAAWKDWFEWRIPNRLLAPAAAAALMLAAFAPDGIGLPASLAGGVTGVALLLPLHLTRGVGAGDVKLLSVIGMFIGPMLVLQIGLLSFLVGGLWALMLLLLQTPLATLLLARADAAGFTLSAWFRAGRRPAPVMQEGSRGSIPYGVVIAIAASLIAGAGLAGI